VLASGLQWAFEASFPLLMLLVFLAALLLPALAPKLGLPGSVFFKQLRPDRHNRLLPPSAIDSLLQTL